MEKPIDFVIAWVDGSDPAWQAEKNRHLTGQSGTIDAGDCRYRDWGNLKYWFRAVEQYAPWVNRVHLVTCGQVPEWLDLRAPKLHLVRHSDYIPEKYLPTFSSHPIELNLHRIEGLSEQFVYFNDDFFLTAPVRPEDFFLDGLPCDSLAEGPVQFPTEELYNSIRVNDIVFANRHFDRAGTRARNLGKWFSPRVPRDAAKNALMALLHKSHFFGIDLRHLPNPYLKRSFLRVWDADPELLDRTCSHKFRDSRDISQFAVRFWQLLSGDFHPYNWHRAGKAFTAGDAPAAAESIRLKKYKMLCINDSGECDFETARQTVNCAFEAVLPQKSSFEK